MREKQFHSKKNKTYLIKDKDSVYVKKIFKDKNALNLEVSMLKKLNGEGAPKLLKSCEDHICIEYIEGMDFVDLLTVGNCDTAVYLGKALAKFFTDLYKKTSLIFTDENLHHYILNSAKGIVRIDLEEYKEGSIKEWAEKLCAFSILYDGIKVSTVKAFLHAFLDTLNISVFSAKEQISFETEKILKRRNRSDFDFSLFFD